MLMRLNYVIVYVADMQRSIAFYRDQLGFPVKMESPEWTEFHTGATTLALHIAKPGEGPQRPRGQTHAGEVQIDLEVLDIETFFQEKKEKGVEFVLPPTMQDFGRKLALFLDPDGVRISVTEEVR